MEKFNLSAALETLIVYLVDGYELRPESLDGIFSIFHVDYTIDGNEIILSEYVAKHQSIPKAVTIYLEIIFPTPDGQKGRGSIHLKKLQDIEHFDVILHPDVKTYKTRYLSECPAKIHPIHWRIWKTYKANNFAYHGQKLTIKILVIEKKGVVTYPYE